MGSSNQLSRLLLLAPIKRLSEEEIILVRQYRCFLFRNFEKVRKLRDFLQQKMSGQIPKNASFKTFCRGSHNNNNKEEVIPKSEEMILTGLTALTTARSMQTRRLAIAQDDPKVTKVVKLAQVLREIFAQVASQCDQNGKSLSKPLQNIPSKKKQPQYYDFIPEPIDLQTIERFINTGTYSQPDQFDRDVLKTFQNAIRFYGQHSLEGSAALKLRKVYNNIKGEYIESLSEIIGSDIPEKASIQAFKSTMFKTDDEDEERIECLCGQYKDEGLMIQCEKCHVWQHCDCVGQTGEDESESYLCPKCGEREAVLDIPLVPQPEYASPGEKYFVSLSRCENLQVRVGDTVYVLRAFKNKMEHDSTSSNEGLLKMATGKPSPKKKMTGKKKEKPVAQKADTGEERKNANNDEPLECVETVPLVESTNTVLSKQDAAENQETSSDNNCKEIIDHNKEQPSTPADEAKNKTATEETHDNGTSNDNAKKPIGSPTEVSVIETESKKSEHESHPLGEESKEENSTLTSVALTEHPNTTVDDNLSNSNPQKESMNVDAAT